MTDKKRKKKVEERKEIVEDALLKQVSGGENTCEDDTGTDTCFDGECWGDSSSSDSQEEL